MNGPLKFSLKRKIADDSRTHVRPSTGDVCDCDSVSLRPRFRLAGRTTNVLIVVQTQRRTSTRSVASNTYYVESRFRIPLHSAASAHHSREGLAREMSATSGTAGTVSKCIKINAYAYAKTRSAVNRNLSQ